jgi:hypothetical protein
MAKKEHAKLSRMEIEPSANGGHTITHHMPMKRSKSAAFMEREEPQKFTFGPEQHEEAMNHIREHLGMGEAEPHDDMEEEEMSA